MNSISSDLLLSQLKWRYATKSFDSTKKISSGSWSTLEEALILSPSSFGLQPWKFIVVTDQATKEKLKPFSWNQDQITACSHLVVLTAKKNISTPEIDAFVKHTAKVRGVTLESLDAYKGFMVGSIVEGPLKAIVNEWAARQLYIALGTLLTSAALLGIDACPMEGFEPLKYNEILGLDKKGLSATVLCAMGYRAHDDKYATTPKVRFDKADVIEHI